LAWLSAVLFYVKQGDRNLGYVAYGAFAVGLTVGLPWLYRWYQRSFWISVLSADSLHGLIGPIVLTVDDEGIEEVGPVVTARSAWRDVLRVDRDSERTLIFLAPLIAVVIPHRAFGDAAAREEFDELVDRCLKTVRSTGTRPGLIGIVEGQVFGMVWQHETSAAKPNATRGHR
jgi:hypothetical protein